MSNLEIFKNEKFGAIRTVQDSDKTLFIASDIAKALGYKNIRGTIKRHCRWVSKQYAPHPQNPKKQIAVSAIPEGDIYRLISNSKLSSALAFESWLYDEVLPQLRKTGSYQLESRVKELTIENEAFKAERDYLKKTFEPDSSKFGAVSKFNGRQRIFTKRGQFTSIGKRKFTFFDGQPYLPFFDLILKNTTGDIEVEILPKAQGN